MARVVLTLFPISEPHLRIGFRVAGLVLVEGLLKQTASCRVFRVEGSGRLGF